MDACNELSRHGFNPSKQLRVKFVGESGIDAGGLMREFFTLVLQGATELLHGPPNKRVFRHNVEALDANKYYLFGKMVAMSLCHGGPLPTFFAPPVLRYLLYGPSQVEACIDDMPDEDVKEKMHKV